MDFVTFGRCHGLAVEKGLEGRKSFLLPLVGTFISILHGKTLLIYEIILRL
jgi:hypothetical protein